MNPYVELLGVHRQIQNGGHLDWDTIRRRSDRFIIIHFDFVLPMSYRASKDEKSNIIHYGSNAL